MRWFVSLSGILCVLVGSHIPAAAEKRVALVIGNSSYVHVGRLSNPANDAKLMADTLKSVGFTLVGGTAQLDLDKAGLDRVVQDFGARLQGADVALFFYAGHGVQVRGANYLVPIGANPTKESDVDFQMLDTNLVLRQMEGAGTRLNIVVLDACRNNPFAGRGLRSGASGLATIQAPEGTLISFATQPGSVAKDGEDGNSPYTKALAKTIRRPGLDIFRTFNEVGLEVKRSTGGTQQPWVSSSPIAGSFYFAAAPAGVQTISPAPVVRADPCAAAADHWRSAEAIGTQAAFEDHLARFPTCAFAGLARNRIEALKKVAVVVPPAPSTVSAALEHAAADSLRRAGRPPGMTMVEQFSTWGVYVHAAEGKKKCFTMARPVISVPKRSPGKIHLIITTNPDKKVKEEISVLAGYVFKKSSDAVVEVGTTKVKMYTEGDGAWIQGALEERRLLQAMREGSVVIVKGTSESGTETTDTFSLRGLAQALDRVAGECL